MYIPVTKDINIVTQFGSGNAHELYMPTSSLRHALAYQSIYPEIYEI